MLKRQDFNHPQIDFGEYAEKRLQECIEFINTKRPDLEKNFLSQFYLDTDFWKQFQNERLRVMYDFAPLSFYFEKEWYDKRTYSWLRDYNGGIIFHGDHDGGGNGGAPTFSVNLTPCDGWATHT